MVILHCRSNLNLLIRFEKMRVFHRGNFKGTCPITSWWFRRTHVVFYCLPEWLTSGLTGKDDGEEREHASAASGQLWGNTKCSGKIANANCKTSVLHKHQSILTTKRKCIEKAMPVFQVCPVLSQAPSHMMWPRPRSWIIQANSFVVQCHPQSVMLHKLWCSIFHENHNNTYVFYKIMMKRVCVRVRGEALLEWSGCEFVPASSCWVSVALLRRPSSCSWASVFVGSLAYSTQHQNENNHSTVGRVHG